MDCGVLIQLDGVNYFVTYAGSAIAAGLLNGGGRDITITEFFVLPIRFRLSSMP